MVTFCHIRVRRRLRATKRLWLQGVCGQRTVDGKRHRLEISAVSFIHLFLLSVSISKSRSFSMPIMTVGMAQQNRLLVVRPYFSLFKKLCINVKCFETVFNCLLLPHRCSGRKFSPFYSPSSQANFRYLYPQDGNSVSETLSFDSFRTEKQLWTRSNKWVLNTTSTPLFFLFVQLIIAVLLFLISHVLGFLTLPFDFNPHLLKGLTPMATLNVFSLT